MFDGPDFRPGCVGPLIALLFGGIFTAFGLLIEKIVLKRRARPWWTPVIALILAPLICCISVMFNIGASEPRPLLQPSEKDMVGTWRVSPDIADFLMERGISTDASEVIIQNNGTFQMLDMPNFLASRRPLVSGDIVTGSGTWRIDEYETEYDDQWGLFLQFDSSNDKLHQSDAIVYLVGQWSPYELMLISSKGPIIRFRRDGSSRAIVGVAIVISILGWLSAVWLWAQQPATKRLV